MLSTVLRAHRSTSERRLPVAPFVQDGAICVAVRTKEIYRSAPDGDRWLLVRDPDNDRVFVKHGPNLSSGGQVAEIEIGAFLIGTGSGPEKQALLRLIGT